MFTADQLVMMPAIGLLDHCKRLYNEAELRVARPPSLTAKVLAHELVAAGPHKEFAEIRDFISTTVPDVNAEPLVENQSTSPTGSAE